jgi:hypothetical protein
MDLKFYHLYAKGQRMKIEQAPVDRLWMDETAMGYAYRCLPMTYANRHGWCIRLTEDVEVTWHGENQADSTEIHTGRTQNGVRFADNGTGNGVVTFHFNAIPRTSKDWNLWIMGAPNLVVPGASALSGVIESDWMFSSPTSNWKLTDPERKVVFRAGDPVIFFVPVHKTELEEFTMTHHSISDDEDMARHFNEHYAWRMKAESEGTVFGKMYLKGINPDGSKPAMEHNHKTRLHLNATDPNGENS